MSLVLTPNSLSTLSSVSIPITLSPTLTTYSQAQNNILPVYSPTYSNLTLTPTQVVTPLGSRLSVLALKPTLYVDMDTGLNDSYVVQKDVTKYFMYKALDKWLYYDYKSALRYLVYKNGKVELVKKVDDKEDTDVSKESTDALEAKSDYIGDHVLTEMKTKLILLTFSLLLTGGILFWGCNSTNQKAASQGTDTASIRINTERRSATSAFRCIQKFHRNRFQKF